MDDNHHKKRKKKGGSGGEREKRHSLTHSQERVRDGIVVGAEVYVEVVVGDGGSVHPDSDHVYY